jgi:sugar O-acyltransferase (sialic acid O-acetyltransferase NeuD family)
MKNNSVALVGYHDGSAGQVESWFEAATGLEIACFVIDSNTFAEINIEKENQYRTCKSTEFPQNGLFKGHPLIVSADWINVISKMRIKKVLCLDPNNQHRLAQLNAVRKSELELVSAIHPSVRVLASAQIDSGVWVNAGCTIGYKAEIRSGVILNTGAQIDHHNILDECCQVDPGVVTAGNVVLQQCCHIHTGAILVNRVKVGKNSIVGAGAVVLKDVPLNCTVVGNPARLIK